MKTWQLWIILAILALCFLAWFIFSGNNSVVPPSDVPKPGDPKPSSPVSAEPHQALSPQELEAEAAKTFNLERQRQIEARNRAYDVPIEFYGKVVDQTGAPIGGVLVTAGAWQMQSFSSNKPEEHQTKTDAGGLFSFHGMKGGNIGIRLEKAGYEFKSDGKLFAYSPLAAIPGTAPKASDLNNPAVFTLWKMKGAEQLYRKSLYVRVPVDGKPVHVDLTNGQRGNEGGDLVLTFIRNPTSVQPGQKFTWQATLQAVDGGLIEMEDRYGNEAPVSGYQSQIQVNMDPSKPPWSEFYEKQFYIKSQSGNRYGRIKLKVIASMQPPPAAIRIEAFINPSGSRNLEFDPAMQIRE
jgi:hypothetical protein